MTKSCDRRLWLVAAMLLATLCASSTRAGDDVATLSSSGPVGSTVFNSKDTPTPIILHGVKPTDNRLLNSLSTKKRWFGYPAGVAKAAHSIQTYWKIINEKPNPGTPDKYTAHFRLYSLTGDKLLFIKALNPDSQLQGQNQVSVTVPPVPAGIYVLVGTFEDEKHLT
jgi:hypothetical protein